MKSYLLILFIACSVQLNWGQGSEKVEKFYDNGVLKMSGQKQNGENVGEWKRFYDSGELLEVYSYTLGKLDVASKEFYKSGILKLETFEQDGIEFQKKYYKSGQLFVHKKVANGFYKEFDKNGVLLVESNYKDHELSGVWKRYYPSQQIEWEVTYLYGHKRGVYKAYYPDGKLKLQGVHNMDQRNGPEKRYASDGTLEWEGVYLEDNFHKKWKRYDADGNVVKTLKYKHGKYLGADTDEMLKTIEVPQGVLLEVPLYPGCEDCFGKNFRKKCMSNMVKKFVGQKFNAKIATQLNLSGKLKIHVYFKISKTGKLIEIRIKAPHKALEQETIRILNSLPEMISPGKYRGTPIVLPYHLPIAIQMI